MMKQILNTPLLGGLGLLGVALGFKVNFKLKIGKIAPITMPYIPPIAIPNFGDLTKLLIDFAMDALNRAATEIAKTMIVDLLDSIFSLCDDPDIAGNILGSAPNTMLNIVRGEICSPRSNDDEVAKTMKNILDSFSSWDVTTPDARPDPGDIQMFAETVSESTSPQELIDLLSGTASEDTVRQVSESVQAMSNSKVKEALSSDASIENLFANLGTLINRNALQARKDFTSFLNTPTDPEICADPFQIVSGDEAIRAALLAKGLNDKQVEEQMEAATNRALDKIGSMAKMLLDPAAAMGRQSGMPIEETPNGPIIKPVSSDPKNDDGLFPMDDQSTRDFNSQLFNEAYDSLENMVMQDLITGNPRNIFSKGFLNMILSAKNGKPYTRIAAETISADGEMVFSDLQKEVPAVVSGLFDTYDSPSDFLEVTNDKVSATYSGIEEAPTATTATNVAGGPSASPPISTFQYQLNGPLFIDYNAPSGRPLERIIEVPDVTDPEAEDVISNVSPSSDEPRDILANWCADSLENYLDNNEDTQTERSAFIEGTRTYVAEKFHRQIIENVLNEYFAQSVDTVKDSNYEAWQYGNDVAKIPKLVELEDDEGFYIERECTQDYTGWLNVYDNALPISLPTERKVPLFNFVDIKEECQNYYDSVPGDDRIQVDFLTLKKYAEPPFSRINTRINNAMLAGISSAVCRLSLYDALIKGSPFFRLYAMNRENYGDLFLSYLTDNVIREVLEESLKVGTINLKPLGVQGYYYLFLEQVVQSYSNMIGTGLILPTTQGNEALRFLTEKLQRDWRLDIKSLHRVRKFKDFIDSSLPQIKVILGEFISLQMEKVAETTSRVFQPKVESLNKNIMEKWLEGGTKSSNFGLNPPGPISVPTLSSDLFMKAGDLNFPFVLQKYVRLVNTNGDSTVISVEEVTEEILSEYVEYFMSTSISLYMPLDYISEFDAPTKSYIKNTLKSKFDESRSFIVTDKDDNTRYLIPLFSKEVEVSGPDLLSRQEIIQSDLNDMILNSGEFEALFKKSIPMSGLLSFVTIYTIENFVDSLAIEKRDQGFQGFAFWNGETFAMSREYLKTIAQQAYYGRSMEYVKQISLDLSSKPINPNLALGIGMAALEATLLKDLPRWKRKKRRPAPLDVCED